MGLRAKFIVIDGPDGSGKGTQLDRLQAWIEAQGGTCRRARDPGGTEIGDRIRHVLLGYDLSKMDAQCEGLLFMASRAQLAAEVIRPALVPTENLILVAVQRLTHFMLGEQTRFDAPSQTPNRLAR